MTTTTAFLIPGTVTQVTDDNGIAWSNILGSVGRDPAGSPSAITTKSVSSNLGFINLCVPVKYPFLSTLEI